MIDSSGADIHRAIVDYADSGRAFAVAVVLKAEGSTPREAATKAVIDPAGAIRGTIGGGAVEAETQCRAAEAIRSGRPLVFDFELEGTRADARQPICGGVMRMLVDPTAAEHRAAYARAVEAERRRERGVLLTSIRMEPVPEVAVRWVPEDAQPADLGSAVSEGVRAALARQTPELLVQSDARESARLEVLIEPLALSPLLVIAGGGHIGQALALHAGLVGFSVTIIDDRAEFTAASLFPSGVATRCGDIARELAELPLGDDSYVVIVTRGHQHDQAALAACIKKPCAYVGMIGSRRKVAVIREDMLDSGAATEAEFDRVYAPVGLDIGAETVPEIAASIVAQLIAVRRRGAAPRMPRQ